MAIRRQPEHFPRFPVTSDQKGHISGAGGKPGDGAEGGLGAKMGRQEIQVHLSQDDLSLQGQPGLEIGMDLPEKPDHLVPAEDSARFSRMQDGLVDTGPE